jgi:serine/threonine-protein kinase
MGSILFLSRYQSIRLLGEGGMARVYLTRRLDGGGLAAVKVLHPQHAAVPHYREAFRREIEFMRRLRHPGAVELYETSMTDPQGPCFAMEYIDGVTLDDLRQRHGRLDPGRVGRILGQLCAVLHAAHSQGIVHRDLKPGNIIVVGADTPGERIKVLDFGLAGLSPISLDGPYIPPEKLTARNANAGFGTKEYACPEQLRGERVDHRGDLYSVGVVLYELLSGHLPFDGSAINEIMSGSYRSPPPLARGAGEQRITRTVEAVVQACLAMDPAHRPQSARELAELYGTAVGQKLWKESEPLPPVLPVTGNLSAVREGADHPNASIYQLEAWMPEQVAAVKLRGFLKDLGGEVMESVPGLIRVRLKRWHRVPAPAPAPGLWAWLGLAKTGPTPEFDPVDMDVSMHKATGQERGRLLITVRLRPAADHRLVADNNWRSWCDQIQRDLSAYLMAKK